jgi:Zn-dependent protease/CBS domain-containing protein
MHASIRFGRVGGVEIGAHWTWLLIFGLFVWSLGGAVFPTENPGLADATYAAMAIVAALLFFTTLVLHELGHALTARREGVEIEGITLWVFGGVAKFKGMFPSAGAEFRIAIAGPIVSLVIGGSLLALAWLIPLPAAVDGVATWLGTINIILLVFNMLPALPLDGGRVLRSLLWRRTGDFTAATRIAGALGQAFGRVLIFGGIALALLAGAPGGLWFALIGWFLTSAAAAETSLATLRDTLAGLTVADAMAADPVVAPGDATLAAFTQDVFGHSRHAAYPVTAPGGEVTGLVSFKDVSAVPAAEWERTTIDDVARSLEDTLVVAPGDPLGDAAVELTQASPGRALVLDGGHLAGLLSITDVSRLLELHRHGRAPSPRAPAVRAA